MRQPKDRQLYRAYQFFKAHGSNRIGYRSVDAWALAKAEQWAEDNDMTFEWEEDDVYADSLGDHATWCDDAATGRDHTHEVLACVAWWGHQVQAALCGIIDPDRNYQRVVEAELACEAKATADAFCYY